LRAVVSETWSDLETVADEWRTLLPRSRADSLFLTWEWMQAWRRSVPESVQLFVVKARDERGRLVGVAPFYRTRFRLGGLLHFRGLRLLGEHGASAEYLDWILADHCEREAALAIARALKEHGSSWDCMWIPRISGWTGARERIQEACAAVGFHCHERPRGFSALALPADYPSYVTSLSRSTRTMLAKRTRQLVAVPDLTFVQCRNEGERNRFLAALFELNHRRWDAKGRPSAFTGLEKRFYEEFTRLALERGWLRLYGATIGGELKAVQIGYVYRGSFSQLQEGFDPEAPPGLGNVLRSKVIELLIAEGVRTYDFLGGFTEHKRRWGARVRTGHDLFIGRRTLKNLLLFAAGIWPTGRYLTRERLDAGSGAGVASRTPEVVHAAQPHRELSSDRSEAEG